MAIQVGPDEFVGNWIVHGAPFKVRPGRKLTWFYVVEDRHGNVESTAPTQESAQHHADFLNSQAAVAVMMKGVYPENRY